MKIAHWILTAALVLTTAVAFAGEPLKAGDVAPDFTLTDMNGKEHKLSEYKGKTVVLEWTNQTCPFVVRHYDAKTMIETAGKYEDVVWLAVDSSHFTTAESCQKWAKKNEIPFPTLLDASGEVGRAYGAKTTPHMFIIDAKGKIAYNGAIDDNPRGKSESATNYVDAALANIKAGKTIETSATKPYGCSVKYGEAKAAKAKAAKAKASS